MNKTIRQIADEIGVSKQAVFKKIKREPLSTSLQGLMATVDGRLTVSVDGENLIKQAFLRSDSSTKYAEVDGVCRQLVDDSSTKYAEVEQPVQPESNNRFNQNSTDSPPIIQLLQSTIDTLQNQLDVKDKLIEELNSRLAESNAALVAAQQTAQTAQALHAGTLQKQLIGDEVADERPQEKSIWQFWKKKRK